MTFTTRNGFRLLIVVSYLTAFGQLVDLAFPSLLAPELQEYFQQAQATPRGVLMGSASAALFIASLVVLVGVLRFRTWARSLYVVVSVLGFVLVALFDEQISSGLAAAFGALSSMISGACLALMFIEPVRGYFERQET
jgi:hypothetical protein